MSRRPCDRGDRLGSESLSTDRMCSDASSHVDGRPIELVAPAGRFAMVQAGTERGEIGLSTGKLIYPRNGAYRRRRIRGDDEHGISIHTNNFAITIESHPHQRLKALDEICSRLIPMGLGECGESR